MHVFKKTKNAQKHKNVAKIKKTFFTSMLQTLSLTSSNVRQHLINQHSNLH